MLIYKDIIIILLYTICFTGKSPVKLQITKITIRSKKIQNRIYEFYFEQIYVISLQFAVTLPSLR